MNILAFDTSTTCISFSIFYRDKFIYSFNRNIEFGSSKLIVYLKTALERYGIKLDEFDLVVAGGGPGSFTGLRIGFSLAKAVVCVLNKPVLSIGSFYSVAYNFKDAAGSISVISDARKGLIYAASFTAAGGALKIIKKECLTDLESFLKERGKDYFVTYDNLLREQACVINPAVKFHHGDVYPDAKNLILVFQSYKNKAASFSKNLEPLYLHAKTCQIKHAKSPHVTSSQVKTKS